MMVSRGLGDVEQPNSGFESDLASWTVTRAGILNESAFAGAKRLEIAPGGSAATQRLKCSAGDLVSAAVQVTSAKNSNGTAALWIRFYAADGSPLQSQIVATAGAPGWSWASLSGSLIAPANTAYSDSLLDCSSETVADWAADEFHFSVVSAPVQTPAATPVSASTSTPAPVASPAPVSTPVSTPAPVASTATTQPPVNPMTPTPGTAATPAAAQSLSIPTWALVACGLGGLLLLRGFGE